VTRTGRIARQKSPGRIRDINRNHSVMVPNRCTSITTRQASTNAPSANSTPQPTLTTTLKIMAGTA
jgi:hypothetical protein